MLAQLQDARNAVAGDYARVLAELEARTAEVEQLQAALAARDEQWRKQKRPQVEYWRERALAAEAECERLVERTRRMIDYATMLRADAHEVGLTARTVAKAVRGGRPGTYGDSDGCISEGEDGGASEGESGGDSRVEGEGGGGGSDTSTLQRVEFTSLGLLGLDGGGSLVLKDDPGAGMPVQVTLCYAPAQQAGAAGGASGGASTSSNSAPLLQGACFVHTEDIVNVCATVGVDLGVDVLRKQLHSVKQWKKLLTPTDIEVSEGSALFKKGTDRSVLPGKLTLLRLDVFEAVLGAVCTKLAGGTGLSAAARAAIQTVRALPAAQVLEPSAWKPMPTHGVLKGKRGTRWAVTHDDA
jgi:hypothetical protein